MSANVALTDTFDQWRVKTNEVVVMTQTDGMSNYIKLLDTTNSTSNTTGSIITAGGVGVLKSMTVGEDLRVHGDLTCDGDTTISGNLVFGDAITDQITFTADINSSIIPNANLSFNLGNTTQLWANTWTGHVGITQNATAAKPALAITSLDIDQIAIDVNASNADGNVLDIAAPDLTTAAALYIDSDSDSTGVRSIATVIQNHVSAVNSTVLTLRADAGRGLFIDTDLIGGGYALEIDAQQQTTGTAKIASAATTGTILDITAEGVLAGAGKVINITADAATTGIGINMSMDLLQTGSAIVIDSNSPHTGIRKLVSITNDHASAVAAIPLYVKQDAPHTAATFDAQTSIVLPVGTTAQRGTATQGALRYNTTASNFEGYNGSAWDDLGGVSDYDDDTKILAETSAGADNDDLDFWTAGTQRMKIDQAGVITVGVDDAGYDVKLFGATASKYWLWDESADEMVIAGTSNQTGNAQLTGTLTVGVDNTGHDVKLFGATASKYWLWDESADEMVIAGTSDQTGNAQLTGTLTVGVNDTGHDVKFFGATSGAYCLWDESADDLKLVGAAGMTIAGDLDVDGTTNLDAVDIDGAVQADGTITVGVNDTGYDVKLFGATSGAYLLWDESADDLKLVGAAGMTIAGDIDVDGTTNLDAVDVDGAVQADGTITVGVNDTGYDVKFFGATSGAYMLWDESADDLKLVGAGGMTIAADLDVDGTTNLDAVDIDGATQIDATVTVGVNDTGFDVKLFGATAGSYWLWDESADGVVQVGTLTVGVDNVGHDVKFFGATASKYWLWDESADQTVLIGSSTQTGNAQLTGTLTVGVNDTGHDVKFFGATASKYMEWDESADTLTIAGTLTETSMRELKTNIEPLENILPAVLQMQGVKFDWKQGAKDNYGFIAEEVDKVFPHLVSHNEEGKPQGIQYTKMTAVLLEAIKEQQVQIDELKAKLN